MWIHFADCGQRSIISPETYGSGGESQFRQFFEKETQKQRLVEKETTWITSRGRQKFAQESEERTQAGRPSARRQQANATSTNANRAADGTAGEWYVMHVTSPHSHS
jgi:hypothetical protein